MKSIGGIVSKWQNLGFCALVVLGAYSAQGGQVKTNYVERWITNAIEVTVPANRFVNEYRTNYIVKASTNQVNVYSTNFVTAYQTNYKTLNVTNWTTVLVLKTNWVGRTLTNVAEVEMGMADNAQKNLPKTEAPERATAAPGGESLVIEAIRGNKQAGSNQADVRLKARWAARARTVQVQQWRVQSREGSILCFGQDEEFRRTLPEGSYKVELKARFDSNGPVITTRATLTVTGRDVTIEQSALAKR